MDTVNGSAPGEEPGRKGHGLQHSDITPLAAVFQELASLPRWVPFRLVFNPKTEKLDKIPSDGQYDLSTKEPTHWRIMADASAIVEEWRDPVGVGLVLTGGIEIDGKRLVGLDFDVVDFDQFELPFKGYYERSPSGKGIRSFLWVPATWVARFKDTLDAHPDHCDHCEIYVGSSARFLTVTFDAVNTSPIAVASDTDLNWLASWLKPADAPGGPAPMPPLVPGKPIDLTSSKLTAKHQKLIAGAGQPEIDRSAVVHSLLILLFEKDASREDALATMLNVPALWQYCLDHRHDDIEKATEFAREEIGGAWDASATGKREALAGFNEKWGAAKSEVPQNNPPHKRKLLSQVLADVKPPVWLIEGVLQMGHLVAVVGLPNSGKTAVGLDLLLRIATGKKLGNRRVERARVAYVAGENNEEIKLRIQIWCALHELKLTELDDWFYLIDEPVFFDRILKKDIVEELAEFAPEVVGIDTFISCFSGESENSSVDVMKWFAGVRENLINPFGCATLVLHHPPKHTDNPLEWRGSGAALGTLDGVWGISNATGAITLTQGKRRGPPFDDLHWRLHTKQASGLKDNFGNTVESIVALPADTGIVSGQEDDIEIRICAALDSGKTTYREIAALIGSSAATVGRTLPKMKKANGTRGRLIRDCQGELRLTGEGKTLAVLGRILLAGRLGNPPGEG